LLATAARHHRTLCPPTAAGTISEVGYHNLRGGWVDPHKLFLDLTGEWELRWTDEKEVNIAVANGLFGLPWIRTYQTIDVPGGRLVN